MEVCAARAVWESACVYLCEGKVNSKVASSSNNRQFRHHDTCCRCCSIVGFRGENTERWCPGRTYVRKVVANGEIK